MRGTLAKRLRARTLANVPTAALLSLSEESRYAPKPGTVRVYTRPTGNTILDEHGNGVPEMVEWFRTCTFALSADCRRHYTQRLKRAYVRQQRRPS